MPVTVIDPLRLQVPSNSPLSSSSSSFSFSPTDISSSDLEKSSPSAASDEHSLASSTSPFELILREGVYGTSPHSTSYLIPSPSSVNSNQSHSAANQRKPKSPLKRARPVVGNNKTGRRGKLICFHCRRIRAKCVFDHQDRPCTYCVRKGLRCEKLEGPLKEEQKALERRNNIRSRPTISPSLPTVQDVNLTRRQNWLLDYTYKKWNVGSAIWAVILQHLADTFGMVPEDPLLLNAILMLGSRQPAMLPNRNEEFHCEHLKYKGSFFQALQVAAGRSDVREELFFALAIAVHCADFDGPTNSERSTFRRMLITSLSHLNSLPATLRMRYMYSYILLLLRRNNLHFCVRDHLPTTFPQHDETYELYEAGRTVPLPTRRMDPRIFIGSIDWLKRLTVLTTDSWQGLFFRLDDDIHSLLAGFFVYIQGWQIHDAHGKIAEILQTVAGHISTVEDNPAISYFLADVDSPPGTCSGPPRDISRLRRRFLSTFLRLQGLYYILEFLNSGVISNPAACLQIIRRVDHAQQHFGLRYTEEWIFQSHALYTVLALLLKCLSPSFEGSEDFLAPHKDFVSKSLNWTPRRGFNYCQGCLSLLNFSLENLWHPEVVGCEGMVHFIKENMWIWNGRGFYYYIAADAIPPVKLCSLCQRTGRTESVG